MTLLYDVPEIVHNPLPISVKGTAVGLRKPLPSFMRDVLFSLPARAVLSKACLHGIVLCCPLSARIRYPV